MSQSDTSPIFHGKLGSIGIQDVMGFAATLRLGGALEVESPDGALLIYLRDGDVVWGRAVRGGVDPGELLVRDGRIRSEDLAPVREEGVADGDLYDILVAAGHLEAEDLEEIRGEELYENILRLFSWMPGEFRFHEGVELPIEAHPIRIEVQGLLLEAARRCDEWSRLPAIYSSPETRFELRADPKNDEKISLGLDEWKLLYLVSSCQDLGEIWEQSPLGARLETSRLLFGLASARLIQPLGGGADDLPAGSIAPDGSFSLTSMSFTGAIPVPPELDATEVKDGETDTAASRPAAAPGAPLPASPAVVVGGVETIRLPGPSPDDTLATVPVETQKSRLTRSQIRVERKGRLVMLNPEEGREFPLTAERTHLGRALDNALILQDSHVSGHHALIVRDGDHFVIEDCGSSNGVQVNGKRMDRSYLRGGEEIEIFPYRFRFEIDFEVFESGPFPS